MPKLTDSLPKYRKHSSGQAFVELAGKRYYLGPHNTAVSKRQYDSLIAQWLAGGRKMPTADDVPEVLTVKQLLAAWLKHAQSYYLKRGRETSTLKTMKPVLRTLKKHFGELDAEKFGPKALKFIREELIKHGGIAKETNEPTGIPASRCYANEAVNMIRLVFRWGVSEELVSGHVWERLRSVQALEAGRTTARECEPVPPVPDEVIDKTLPFLSQTLQSMVRLQRATGARPSEICNLKPSDIDRSADVWIAVLSEHKTQHHGKKRRLFLGAAAQEILAPYLNGRKSDHPLFSPKEAEAMRRKKLRDSRTTPLSCGNQPGSNRKANPKRTPRAQYDTNSYRRAIHRACDLPR